MRRVLLFVNPVFEQRASHRAAIDRVAAFLRSTGLLVAIHETLSPRSAGDQARQAIEDGFDTILVCGGDGTVFNVIQGVAGTEIPVGILPFGTGNVLAQNIGLPRNPLRAARLLIDALPRRIPLGRITLGLPEPPAARSATYSRNNNWFFAMAAGVGLHAALMNASQRWGKYSIGRASYYLGGASLLLGQSIQPFDIEVTTTTGEVFQRRVCEAIAVRVAELNRWRPGGQLEAGHLRLATVDATGRFGFAKACLLALARASAPETSTPAVHYSDVLRVVCRPISNHAYQSPLLAEADGEVLGATQAVIEMAKESFYLLWPS